MPVLTAQPGNLHFSYYAPGWIRTSDLALRRRALYPLSYGRSASLA